MAKRSAEKQVKVSESGKEEPLLDAELQAGHYDSNDSESDVEASDSGASAGEFDGTESDEDAESEPGGAENEEQGGSSDDEFDRAALDLMQSRGQQGTGAADEQPSSSGEDVKDPTLQTLGAEPASAAPDSDSSEDERPNRNTGTLFPSFLHMPSAHELESMMCAAHR
jgi:hypothetical protein